MLAANYPHDLTHSHTYHIAPRNSGVTPVEWNKGRSVKGRSVIVVSFRINFSNSFEYQPGGARVSSQLVNLENGNLGLIATPLRPCYRFQCTKASMAASVW